MVTKHNIKSTILDMEEEIRALTREIQKPYPEPVQRALRDRLNSLSDNCYRYKLQAKAWGIGQQDV